MIFYTQPKDEDPFHGFEHNLKILLQIDIWKLRYSIFKFDILLKNNRK